MRRFPAFLVFFVAATALADPVRYLALGDSFTIGTGSSEKEAFPSQLMSRLQARGQKVALLNVAVNGYSAKEVLERELPELARFKPNLVTLAIGANDIVRNRGPEEFRKNVKQIFAALAAAKVPPSRVFVLPQPDWSKSPVAEAFGDPVELLAKIKKYDAILSEEAKAAGARTVELFALMQDQAAKKMVAPDGLHPNAAAHAAWAERLEPLVSAER